MNDTHYKSIDFGALTRAGEGLTQWRALAMGFITVLAASLVFFLMQQSAMRLGGILGVLLGIVFAIVLFVVWVGGASAVGVLLMDKARNIPQRSIGEAALAGLASVPKFLLFGIATVFVSIAFMLVAALIYFICKIPVLGAVLAFVAHPVLVLIASVFIISCMWVVFPLFAPAVWSGLGFKQALASIFAIARNRLVQVVLMMMVLYIILVVIGMLIISGVVPAMSMLTGLAAGILGGGVGGYGAMHPLASAMSMFSSASMTGAVLGAGVLTMLMFALAAIVGIMGVNVLYLQAADGLDTAGTASDIDDAFGAMKEKAREAAEKAKATAERAKQAAAERAQAREEAALEQARQDEEAAQQLRSDEEQRLAEQREVAEREAAARDAAEREAREAQVRAEAQRQEAARAAATQAPSAGAAALGALAAGAAAAGADQANTPTPPVPPAAASESGMRECKACGHHIGADDVFCENCGTKQ